MLLLIVIILTMAPVIRWFMLEPLSLRFLGFTSSVLSLGQILGLAGMMLFSLNLILGSRAKFLDKIFGLDRIYRYHHLIGGFAFIFLLFHPLFLAAKYITYSFQNAALLLLPTADDLVKDAGIISLAIMIILLYVTFFSKLRYNVWKAAHKYLTVAFIFGFLHVIFVSSDISRDPFLRRYIILFAF